MLAAFVLAPATLAAQGYEAQQFHPSPNPQSGYASSQSGQLMGQGFWETGIYMNFASKPLVVNELDGIDPLYRPINGNVVTSQTTLHLLGAYGIFNWLEVGCDLPLFVQQDGDRLTGLENPDKVDSSFGIGDIRLIPKARLYDTGIDFAPHRISVSMALGTILPSGSQAKFQGGSFGLNPLLAVEWHSSFGLQAVGNLGYAWRADAVDVLGVEVDDSLIWSFGAVQSLTERFSIVAEVFGDLSKEALLGLKSNFGDFQVMAAAGAGLTRDSTTPTWRLLVGVSFHYGEPDLKMLDSDLDGIADTKDSCPKQAEDVDGFQDEDGCPDPDNDQDQIADVDDRCPFHAEDIDGVEDKDGCPDLDNDQDGIVDSRDKCPNEPEDFDGFADSDGCPEWDNDGDGIADAKDSCPTVAEDKDGDRDLDGCPDYDRLVTINVVVFFEKSSAEIPLEDTVQLDRVARSLLAMPEKLHVWVEGHADDSGSAENNQVLSLQRADIVRGYLIEKGVPAERISSQAYGETQQLHGNQTLIDQLSNRRVEFRVAPKSLVPKPKEPVQPGSSDSSQS